LLFQGLVTMVTPQQLDSENCSVEGCPAEGRRRYHVKGQPTLCDEHFAAKARANANGSGSNEQRLGLVEQVPKLERLARRLERARRKAEPAVRELKAAQNGTRRRARRRPRLHTCWRDYPSYLNDARASDTTRKDGG
jgi:hypothetical protein